MPNPCKHLDRALQLLADAVRATEDNIDTSIEAWKTLQLTYDKVHKKNPQRASFEAWGLENIDIFLIKRIGEWIHTAHFESLSEPKTTELRKIASAFNTDIWMIYFVLGEGLIESVKGLKGILRCRRVLKDLTLERLLSTLETAREKRKGVRSRNVSNDMAKFTLSDVKCCELALCPMLSSPPSSIGDDLNSVTPDPEPATHVDGFLPNTFADSPNLLGSSDDGDISEWDNGTSMVQDPDPYMMVSVQATTSDTSRPPKPSSFMCEEFPREYDDIDQTSQFKRRRTKPHSPDLTMDELSPQTIIEKIITTKQLVQLASVPLLRDHGLQDLVDSKVWRFLQNFIVHPTQCGPINDIIQYMELTLDEERSNYDLSDYIYSAERAIASAQVLREIVRRSQNVVQTLQTEYEKDIEHLESYASSPSAIRYHIQANAQQNLCLLVRSLKILFERTEDMVGELKEYRLQVLATQRRTIC